MSATATLIVEVILALVTLGVAHKNAKDISEEEIQAEIENVYKKFRLKDPNYLPEV